MTSQGTMPALHVSVTIERPPAEVYAFVVDPANLPRWAAGLGGAIAEVAGEWVADSPMGKVTVRFAPANDLGVLDHDVTLLATGETFHNPMRVVANGSGSEIVFTLFRREGTTDEEFSVDRAAIARDLAALQRLLEKR
jgi:uncharacterized protein YndB with AHSA1/START domain